MAYFYSVHGAGGFARRFMYLICYRLSTILIMIKLTSLRW